MLSLFNPVADFYGLLRGLWDCIPLALQLLVTLCFGVMLLFALMRTLKGG